MRLNLIMMFIWLLIAVPVLLVNLANVNIPDVPRSQEALMIGALAGMLALYNFVRWFAGRNRSTPTLPPPEKKRIEGKRLEYNPQFDFGREDAKTLRVDEPDERQ